MVVPVAVGGVKEPCRLAFAPVDAGALVGIPVQIHDLLKCQGMVGLNGKGVLIPFPSLGALGQVRGGSHQTLGTPYPVEGEVGMVVLYGLHGAHPVQIPLLVVGSPARFLQRFRQLGIVNLIGISLLDGMDAELVGCHEELPIRHPLGNPETALPGGSRLHFQHPAFVLIRHQQGFPGAPKAILIYEGAHELHCLPGGAAALQGYPAQLRGVENPPALPRLQIFQMSRIIGALPQHQAMLIHNSVIAVNISIGVGSLRDFPQRFGRLLPRAGIVLSALGRHQPGELPTVVLRHLIPGNGGRVDLPHLSRLMLLGRHIDDIGVTGKGIIGVGHQSAAIRRGSFGDDGSGACLGTLPGQAGCQKCRQDTDGFLDAQVFFHVLHLIYCVNP